MKSQQNKFNFISLILLCITIVSCDKGITPEPESIAGFSGKITFTGTWPDSITRTHIVLFKDPLLSASDFSALNLRYVSLEIPYGSTEYDYSTLDSAYVPQAGKLPAGEYSYLAVAMSKTADLSLNRIDWFVAGLYFAGGNTSPGKLIIPENTLVRGINILCDFNNPPPQPPGGN